MSAVPELSPTWPPTAGQLAGLATAAHWQLEELAYRLPRGQVNRAELEKAARGLQALAELLLQHHPDETAEPPAIETEGTRT